MVALVMSERGQVRIEVTFGPTRAPSLPRVIAVAREHAERFTEASDGTYRVRYLLDRDPSAYAHASALVWMVSAWRTTTVTLCGEPVDAFPLRWMLACAPQWLASHGRCQAMFSSASPQAKCRSCPLYDPEWALEAWGRPDPSWAVIDGVMVGPEVITHVPPEWCDPPEDTPAS